MLGRINIVVLLLYVGDITITGCAVDAISEVINSLTKEFRGLRGLPLFLRLLDASQFDAGFV